MSGLRQTHTYAILDISAAAYREIHDALRVAGYADQFSIDDGREIIDMHGIAVRAEDPPHPNTGDT
jgi:hypothetical protein